MRRVFVMCPLPSPAIKCDPAAASPAAARPDTVSLMRTYLGHNCPKPSHVHNIYFLHIHKTFFLVCFNRNSSVFKLQQAVLVEMTFEHGNPRRRQDAPPARPCARAALRKKHCEQAAVLNADNETIIVYRSKFN